ncbi:BREX-1 system adenine-specific DNA-methyltransferase PglX [Corallococcus sp. BB11-1]|uniref:BREX-1 system adenine-specific DNA-methyltransferase PglX n=1 Tax=Corallococcus sp. BB11-1 TaxID=2996783 RepID=UPI0022711DDC|nr:BREX-1 system adenine-specific DNA-methyltransferase PglX [Corallococcus sp. BB11-1]MCY1033291.1 BREX-1 system adenine-specific DNA-methyltransferase PglX [Corallococcus sp. BB11-1]
MDKDTRNAIERATQRARKLLEEDFAVQLDGDFDVHQGGAVAAKPGVHLSARQAFQRERIVAAIEHKRAAGMSAADSVADYLRDAAFTTLNRFVALKMLEARELVQECITKGEQSAGYREFCGMARGLPLLPDSAGYRLYIESLFDELSTEVKVLFDRRDPSSVLWPKRTTFEQLLEILSATELARVWGEDETIGWVYQFFNGQDERRKMREESQAPRNSRELAVRNQFFTPRYVVQFLTDNTLGRIWYEMRSTNTVLTEKCEYMVRNPGEELAPRAKKDPRDLRVLDPACGSGHFLLYAFDLLLTIYEEAYSDPESPKSEATGKTLAEDYPSRDALRKAVPGLVLAHNLHGVDIDPRCAQIAQLALWMRAQKAFRDYGIGRAERAQIRRSNIVVAEPLVADEQIAKEFVAKLGDAELGRVFTGLIDALKLAGDLGLLLRIETRVARQPMRGQTGDLFAPPEERIRSALARFAAEGGARRSTRHRIFADEMAHGVGLLTVAEEQFDVVVMNPPFGLPVDGTFDKLSTEYPGAHHDIFAAFVQRAVELAPHGLVGCISSRSFLVTTRLEDFRRKSVLPSITLLADLGPSVMDNASVESAAYTLQAPAASAETFAVLSRDDLHSLASREPRGRYLARAAFQDLPSAKILHSLPTEFLELLRAPTVFEGASGTAREGMKSFDNFRFVRTWWEVELDSIGANRQSGWTWFAKGGGHVEWFVPSDLVLNWGTDGRELQEINLQLNGSTAQVRQASTYWLRRGATYSRRSIQFAVRVLPEGHIFSTEGPAVLLEPRAGPTVSDEYLLGWLNARLCRLLVEMQANKQKYLTGIIKRLPWRVPPKAVAADVSNSVAQTLRALVAAHSLSETAPHFVGLPRGEGFDSSYENALRLVEEAKAKIRECQNLCNDRIDALYGVDSSKVREVLEATRVEGVREEGDSRASDGEGEDGVDQEPNEPQLSLSRNDYARRVVGWAIGHALGRWQRREPFDPAPMDPFAEPVPTASQLESLQGSRKLAAASEDWGAPDSLLSRVREAVGWQLRQDEQTVEAALCRELGVRDLGEYLSSNSSNGAWANHLATHTSGRRRAPVYWRLTAGAVVGVWINYLCATQDTLPFVVKEVVEPWIAYLGRAAAASLSVAEKRALMARADGLNSLLSELRLVAPLWNPHLDDGVIINFAPLWRLVPQNKAWQRELKSTWDALCEGKYDWAHLAMHLWPERVVPKCARDRSLAIAHGLEDVFWVERTDGKWTAQKTPTRSVDELVRERTSTAVKSALQSLLEASAATGNAKKMKKGKANA